MRTIDPALKQDFVDGYRTTLLKLTTNDGTVYGWSDHDMPLTVDGLLYTPAAGMTRTNLTNTVNDIVSNQTLASAWVDAPETDMLAGKFDNAYVEVAFCSWDKPNLGRFVIDTGHLGVIQWTADGFRADIQSHMRDLQLNINEVFTLNCRHQLFDQFSAQTIGACTLNALSYTYAGTVSAIITDKMKFSVTGLAQPDKWCAAGKLTWTTGANAGLSFEVKNHTVGATTDIELYLPTWLTISVGDQFSITAGCDKTFATCKNKFNNVVNFGGFKDIQVQIQYR